MKGGKSPDSTEVTPSKKKLKQARLPFMVLSDVSPKTIQPRKRKLSGAQDETVSKIGKISDENIKDSIVISDEEIEKAGEEKMVNPFVKLVDSAFKKKVQKSKVSKKKKGPKKNATCNKSSEDIATSENETKTKNDTSDIESMEVDECVLENGDEIAKDKTDESPKPVTADLSIVIDDSNDNTDQNIVQKDTSNIVETKEEDNNSQSEIEAPKNTPDLTSPVNTTRASLRNRIKIEKKGLDSSMSSKLDESVTSAPSTPKTPRQNRSVVNGDGDVSLNNSNNTTPKQAQKRLESAKKKEEREKERVERELKKQQEKEERVRQKIEKEEQRKKEKEEKEAAKKKEREEKEELRRKDKEEKEKQKELEKKLKEEKEEQKKKEREEKEEQRKKEKEAREEEKRKKQEALELEKQEQELKKKKAAEAFANFFVPKQKSDKEETTIESSKNSMLSTFAVKSDMRLAPTTRKNLSENEKKELENYILKQELSENKLYVNSLKNGNSKPMSSAKTWPLGDKDDDNDVIIVEDELPPMSVAEEIITCEPAIREKLRPKLLSFHQNRRPPYWGTWRKKSSNIKPRRPFGQDKKLLDYEVDSDDDWEEEQEGESLDGSVAGSDDDQDNDEYEVDNEVFVPHGYLSDEEATMDEDDVLSLSPEAQKQKLKHLEEEFEFELKKPTEKLKPRLFGPIWVTNEGRKPDNCVDTLWNYFGKLAMIMNDPAPFLKPTESAEETEKKKTKKKKVKAENKEGEQTSPKEKKKKIAENKETKKDRVRKAEPKKIEEQKKNQPGINSFLTKIKSTA